MDDAESALAICSLAGDADAAWRPCGLTCGVSVLPG